MVALKHKARLLLHWHHICFGLAYMAGTPQRCDAWIMFRRLTARGLYGESSSLRRTQCWAERLFVVHSPVTFLLWSGLELFIYFFAFCWWLVQGYYTARGAAHRGSSLILRKQFSSLGLGLEMPWYFFIIIILTIPPSIFYLYTDSSYFYTYCKTINKSQREWNWYMKEEWKS